MEVDKSWWTSPETTSRPPGEKVEMTSQAESRSEEDSILRSYSESVRTKPGLPIVPLLLLAGLTSCFYMGAMGSFTIVPQYVLTRFYSENNITVSENATDKCHINQSDPNYEKQQKLQEKSSAFIGGVTFIGGIPSLLTVFLYGAFSDQLGRKVIIFIPYIGQMIINLTMTFIVNFHLNINILLAASFLSGLTGSASTMLAGVFAYIADITVKSQRSLAIGVIEASLGMSMVVANLIIGFWIELSGGYGLPMIGVAAITAVSVVFLIFLKETRPRRGDRRSTEELSFCDNFCRTIKSELMEIKKLLGFNKRRSICLILLVIGFTLHGMTYMGLMATITLYLMNQPFCWTPGELGIYNAVRTSVWMFGGLGVLASLRNRLPDTTLALLSLFMYLGSLVVQGTASLFDKHTGNVFIIISAIVGFTEPVAPILMRSMASKLVTADEQGAVFGLVSTGEAFSIAFGPTIMSVVYTGTVSHWKGFVFYFAGVIVIIVAAMIVAYRAVLWQMESYGELEEDEGESI